METGGLRFTQASTALIAAGMRPLDAQAFYDALGG
jgi:hypothetical protein